MTKPTDKPIEANGLTRREFNTTVAATGAAVAAAGMIAGGPRQAAAQGTPKKGGKIKAAWDSTSAKDTMDPAKTLSLLDLGRATLMYNRIVEVGPDMKLRPGLAVSWEGNKKADEWVFRIRKGVTFHNGKPLTAQDVIYTIHRVLNPDVASPARVQLEDIDPATLKADDQYTVRFKLKSPNADIPGLFAIQHLHVVPLGATDFMKPIGTGPFMCKSFEPGINAVFVRNPNYWKGNGMPYLDEVETVGIPDPTARFNALLANDIQAMTKVDAGLLARAKSSPGIDIMSTPGPAHATYPMRSDAPPFQSNDVRLALKYAVDRQKLLDLAYAGQGTVANDQPVPPFDRFYCAENKAKPYDPDKVKFHLKKANAESTVFELYTSTAVAGGVDAANVYAEMANKAGANVKVVVAPADGYWAATWMKKPWAMSFWWGRPTADSVMSVTYTSGAKWNEGAWKSPKFDQLLSQARGITDDAKRKQLYCEAQLMLSNEGPTLIPVFTNWIDGKSSKLKGIVPHPMGSLGLFFWDGAYLDT
ncbi:MAG: ABC transporter substrate-binding protein [Alphaproteobacteria bacterium]